MRLFHQVSPKVALASSLVAWLLMAPNIALALRCGNDLVAEGDSKRQVLRACGEPEYRELIGYREMGPDTVKIEIWFYDFGTLKFTQTLTFHGNRLHRIEAGDYGGALP